MASAPTREVKVADIGDVALNQTVEVTGKVWRVDDVKNVKRKRDQRELRKQDVSIGDESFGICYISMQHKAYCNMVSVVSGMD